VEDHAEIPNLCKYNTKKDHRGIEHEIVRWIYMDLDNGQWQGLVKVRKIRVPYQTRSLLSTCGEMLSNCCGRIYLNSTQIPDVIKV
jgi:hypothetical protein